MNKKIRAIFLLNILIIILLPLLNAENETMNEPMIIIDVDDTSIEEEEIVIIDIIINFYGGEINKIKINYGDGDENTIERYGEESTSIMTYHQYKKEGEYELKVIVNNEFESGVKKISVEKPEDPDEKPTLEISYPLQNQTIQGERIEFKFTPDDDKKLNYCNFEVHGKVSDQYIKEWETKIENPEKGTQHSTALNEFKDKDYFVKIVCQDNKSQNVEEKVYFKVKTQNHEKEKEILSLIDTINNLTKKKSSLPDEESKALDELELFTNLRLYKNRLTEINSRLTKSEGLTEKTDNSEEKRELFKEVEELKEKIPKDLQVIDTQEYLLNKIPDNFEEILKSYLAELKEDMNKFEEKRLIEKNQEIQTKASTSVKIVKINLDYGKSQKIITIIKKEVKISDSTIKKILEFIPEKGNRMTFASSSKKINDKIYELEIEKLKGNKIIYSIEEDISLEDVKKIETILYQDFPTTNLKLIGFATYDLTLKGNSKYFSLLFLLAISTLFVWKSGILNKEELKSSENISKIKKSIKKGIEYAKKEDLPEAKERYKEIREEYRNLSPALKRKIYSKIEKLRIEIDKREMRDFIKEYKKNKRDGNKIEAQELFEEIKKRYTRLPKKFQRTIYQKVIISN